MRALTSLVDDDRTGLNRLAELLQNAARPAERLDCLAAEGDAAVVSLQVETRALLGAMAHRTGGVLIDGGWLRLLGTRCARLPRGLTDWNQLGQSGGRVPGALLVADDAIVGLFALNQGGLLGDPGDVCWLSPQSLEWESLNIGYDGFVEWALGKGLDHFYAAWRWPGWEEDVKALPASDALVFEPPAAVPGSAYGERKREARPVELVYATHSDTLPRLLRAPRG